MRRTREWAGRGESPSTILKDLNSGGELWGHGMQALIDLGANVLSGTRTSTLVPHATFLVIRTSSPSTRK